MSRVSILIIALSVTALAGGASAQTFQASFNYNSQLSAEENYASFEKTARKACAVSVKVAGSLRDKALQERDCSARLMTDAVKTANDMALSSLHDQRSGVSKTAVASRD